MVVPKAAHGVLMFLYMFLMVAFGGIVAEGGTAPRSTPCIWYTWRHATYDNLRVVCF